MEEENLLDEVNKSEKLLDIRNLGQQNGKRVVSFIASHKHAVLDFVKFIILASILIGGALELDKLSRENAALTKQTNMLQSILEKVLGNQTIYDAVKVIADLESMVSEVEQLKETMNALWTSFDELNKTLADAGSIPVGSLLPFGFSTPPSRFLLCDGTAVGRTEFALVLVLEMEIRPLICPICEDEPLSVLD